MKAGKWLFVAGPAITWTCYGMLFVPYLALRAKGDEIRPWFRLGEAEEGIFGVAPPRLLQDYFYAREIGWLDLGACFAHLSWFLLPFVAGLALTLFERKRLLEYQAWLLAAFYLSAISFVLFPVRPPWMEEGVNRVLIERSFIEYTGVDNNQVAAFPSLHAGLPAVMAVFFFVRCRRLRFVGWVCVGATAIISVAVIYLGEHWVLDVLAGYALAGVVALLFVHPTAHRAYSRIPGDPIARLSRLNTALSTYQPRDHEERQRAKDLPKAA